MVWAPASTLIIGIGPPLNPRAARSNGHKAGHFPHLSPPAPGHPASWTSR